MPAFPAWPTPHHRRRKPLGRCPRPTCDGALRKTSKPGKAHCVKCGHETTIERD